MREIFLNFLRKTICLHDWEEIKHIADYGRNNDSIPVKHIFLYKCSKCGKFKRIEL